MKKFYLLLVTLLALSAGQIQAQTILEEDFETGATASQASPLTRGEGWTQVNTYSGEDYRYRWYNEYRDPSSTSGPYLSGAGCASCDGPTGGNNPDGAGPREEILLSPELNLNDTYQLQFSWSAGPMASQDNSRFDLQVRVVEEGGNPATAETVFSIQDPDMLRESGVSVSSVTTWDKYVSKIDLSYWQGKRVKLAFVYKMMKTYANVARIDDITVKKFTPATGPVPSVNFTSYNFKGVYIGEKVYSDVITLTNIGKNGLTITGIDAPAGFSTTLDPAKVNLRTYDKVMFNLAYAPELTTPASGNIVIHTNGGDVTIAVQATKQAVPDGYTLETFNGTYFPPAGWKNTGWRAVANAIEGDQSAYCGGDYSDCILRSPMIDLINGGSVTFTYVNQYDGESFPDDDIRLEVSVDGGSTWTEKWKSEYDADHLNTMLTQTVDLGVGSDESYIRFRYPAATYDAETEEYPELSFFTLDRVLLPHVVGADGVPQKATIVAPAIGAENVYPRDVKLEWGPAQFAKGYKLYVGTTDAANDLINGQDMAAALSYVVPVLPYETVIKWKVVGYNDKGDGVAASGRFTTQPDASVMTFPYEENFDACSKDMPVPTGWLSTTTGSYPSFQPWTPNNIYPYGGKGVSLGTGWKNQGEQSILTSPEFKLPAEGKSMSISFVWGDDHPSDLKIDETGLTQKVNVNGGNGSCAIAFEIRANGGEWTQLSYISQAAETDGKRFWRNESIELDQYAGMSVQFRWVNTSLGNQTGDAALDNVVIDGTIVDGVAFNKASWNAGKINYNKSCNSGTELTMRNSGKNALTVKSVSFTTDNFESDIQVGRQIAAKEGINFSVTFNAKTTAAPVEDVMTITFEGTEYTASFPVSGEALAEDVLFYGFEKNALDYDWKKDFYLIDKDGSVNYRSNYYLTVIEDDGGRYAFTQAIHSNPNLTAHTGIGTAVAAAPDNNSAANDWMISRQIIPAENATFDFYARNLATEGSVFVGDNDLHSVEVLVSDGGYTDTNSFTTVMNTTEMKYLAENEWNHFTVDLSAYAGKPIYVAVHHTTVNANWMAFFDDYTFSHVALGVEPNAIQAVKTSLTADTMVTVYTADGVQVAQGRAAETLQSLRKGLYVIKAANGQTLKTVRM